MLTLGAVLTSQAYPVHPVPVLRGKPLLERFARNWVSHQTVLLVRHLPIRRTPRPTVLG